VEEDAHNRAKWWQAVKKMTIHHLINSVDGKKRIETELVMMMIKIMMLAQDFTHDLNETF